MILLSRGYFFFFAIGDRETFHQFMKTFKISDKDTKVTFEQFKKVLDSMDKKYEKTTTQLRALFDKFDNGKSGVIKRRDMKRNDNFNI